MNNEISNERLEEIVDFVEFLRHPKLYECAAMAKELLALRKAFSVPDCWEIAGQIFATEEEALSYGYRDKPAPIYGKSEE